MTEVVAFHVILTCYGFWLPNDPRGSWSTRVWAKHLRRFGPATGEYMQRSSAGDPHDWRIRKLAKSALKFPAVVLSGKQALCVATAFGQCLSNQRIRCFACAVLPEHSHLVLENTEQDIDALMIDLKAAAVKHLLDARLHPFQEFADRQLKIPKMWARNGFKTFLFDHDEVVERIHYVEDNPLEAGLKRQQWSFVVGVDE